MASVISEDMVLIKAVESVLKDESFQVCSSPQAKASIITASKVLKWSGKIENQSKLRTFSNSLLNSLKQCFRKGGKNGSLVAVRHKQEQMWGYYHCLRTSPEYQMLWESFLLNVQEPANPTFFQHITDIVFRELVKVEFPVNEVSKKPVDTSPPPTHLEENSIRYVAGYVLFKIEKKLEKSSWSKPVKEAMVFCVKEMSGYELINTTTEEWTDVIDRGGLWHINDNTYCCFYMMEIVIRCYLVSSKVASMDDSMRSRIIDAMVSNENLRSQWTITTATTIKDDHSFALFKMVVELYLTVRGFAFVKSCLELYKQAIKRQIAKSKGIRKDLFTSKTSKKNQLSN